MKKIIIYLLSISSLIIFIEGCSSGSESTKNETRYGETPTKKIIKNIENEERSLINSLNIRSIEKIEFNFDKEQKPVNREKLSTANYNGDGLLTETIIYDSKGKIEFRYVYEYGKNNLRTKTIRYNSSGEKDKYYTYEYNEWGNKTKSSRFSIDGKLEKYYLYDYDDEGNLIEEKWFDTNGNLEYKILYEYDDGRKSNAKSFNQSGKLISRYEFKYDNNNSVVEEIRYNSNDDKIGFIQYVYRYF